MTSILEILQRDIPRISETLELDVSTARIEVRSLLQHVLQVQRAYLLAHPEHVPDVTQLASYDALLSRRLRGEPVAYLLGEREFFGLNFKVTPATLIPRPDTELLVELALERIPSPPAPDRTTSHSTRPPKYGSQVAGYLPRAGEGDRQAGRGCAFRVLDLGTGTGAIALSIAHSKPDVAVTAVDASEAALEVARENAQRLGVANTSFLRSDWFSALDGQRFDLIVSNPPYVADGDAHLAQGDVRFEPLSALASGADGLDDIRSIASQAAKYLEQGAWLLMEHGYDQAAQVRDIFRQNGYVEIFSAKDIAGLDRVSGGVKSR